MSGTRMLWVSVSVFLLSCGDKTEKKTDPSSTTANLPAAAPNPMAGPGRLGVGSSQYYVDLAGLNERYQDLKSAAEQFAKAADLAESPALAAQAYNGLGRVRHAQKDLDGAIEAYEKGQAERAKATPQGGPAGPAMMMAGPDDGVTVLAQLYTEKGRHAEAEKLISKQLEETKMPYQQEQLIRALMDVYRKQGTLDKKIEEKEAAIGAAKPDEMALRFLVVAYGGNTAGMMVPAMPGESPAKAEKLVLVYKRLHELRPEDGQIRQALINAFEKAGHISESLALLRSGGAPAAGGPAVNCPPIMTAMSSSLSVESESVRLLLRVNHKDEARAEIGKIMAACNQKKDGAGPCLVAANLYGELGDTTGLAERAIGAAQKLGRSPEEQRQIALARADWLNRSNKRAELEALYKQWKQSSDPCLKMEGERRVMVAMPPPPAMAIPPSPTHPPPPRAIPAPPPVAR